PQAPRSQSGSVSDMAAAFGSAKAQAKPKPGIASAKIGRNDPCPCGSGLKFKKCGLINSPKHRS
ncbi:MAG: SEC-C metal-binding domain-containing protein, partial [Microgenomates group bacterium]